MEIKTLKATIQDLGNQNSKAITALKTLSGNESIMRKETESAKAEIIDLTGKLADEKSRIAQLTVKIHDARKIRVFKELTIGLTILTGAFGLGIYFGNTKFDNDKNNMADKIRNDKTAIDSLKKIIKIEKSISTIEKIK